MYRKILDLTDTVACQPREDPGPAEGRQLALFPDTTEIASCGERSAAESLALGVLMKETPIQAHTTEVNSNRALGEHLVCDLPFDHAHMQLRQDTAGIRSLASAIRRLTDRH
ncbi:hypothetical protein ACH4SK_44110 [Streptomyces inhibens]|uniref:hypothetical protein n=1 Tax=Streptomyces inhibens TaxID=2293571 RepID=UPI0037B6F5F4